MTSPKVSAAPAQSCAASETQRYLRSCDDGIEQTLQHIDAIETSSLSPDAKRRALSKARSRLTDLQQSAARVRHMIGAI